MTKVDRVGPMFKGKTPPVGEDKHRFYKRVLKGFVVVCHLPEGQQSPPALADGPC